MAYNMDIFTKETIEACPWPQTQEGAYAKKFLAPIVKLGAKHFVANIETQFAVLCDGNIALPITINYEEYDNSFVCSPFSHYVSYSSIVLNKLTNPVLKGMAGTGLRAYAALMKRGKINRVVIVNNWLFTTNPTPDLTDNQLDAITSFLKQRFPTHAILFRAVTEEMCKPFVQSLRQQGFDLLASRYMNMTNGADETVFNTRIFKSDRKFVREAQFQTIDSANISNDEIERLQKMYHALYIKKYSPLNPQFTPHFFSHIIENQLLDIKIAKKEETLAGIAGFMHRKGQMISPLFGYDPEIEEHKGIYRYLSTLLMLESQKYKALFNQSAGGGFFKKLRRAYGSMEYTAVYTAHLPLRRKIPWKFLKGVVNTVGAKAMKKYDE